MGSLNEVQRKLKAPKGQFNSFGKYNYRSCEDILEAVKPLLGDSVILLSDDICLIGSRYYVKASAIFRDGNGSEVIVTAYAREAESKKGMDESQITGAASSYARKYALNGLLLIDDTKDADTGNNNQDNNKQPSREKRFNITLASGRDIKTAGIQADALAVVKEFTDEYNLARLDMNDYLTKKSVPNITFLTEEEGEELKALLMEKYAESKLEIESDDIDGLADFVEKELDTMVDKVITYAKNSDTLFKEGE